jgi:TonB family protein
MLFGPKLFNRQRTLSSEAKPTEFKLEPAPKPVAPEAGQSRQRSDDKKQGSPQAAPVETPVQSEAGASRITARFVASGKVVHQVLPNVPRSAKATIQGRVKVGVRVRVDPSGNVTGAKLDSAGPSKYFAGLALQAARRWKFDPAKVDDRNVPSEWILRFQFGRTGTTVLPVRAAP